MSLIFGCYSKNGSLQKLPVPFSPEIKYEKKELAIYAGGQSIISFNSKNNLFNIISGTALSANLKLLDRSDWEEIVDKDENLSKLNGHFLAIIETEDGLQIVNDQLGLRELFFYENKTKIFFSTRLDWLIKQMEFPSLNTNFINSLWSFENPLIYETMFENILLLGPGGKAKISSKGIDVSNNPWLPHKKEANIEYIVESVSQIIDSIISQKGKVNLGMSGGMDSRSLLSLLLSQDNKNWESHTFGQKSNFDVKIANHIAKYFKFNHVHHDVEPFKADNTFGTWKDFVLETNSLMPANNYHELSYYKDLPKGEFFIDGGKGEYLRRGLSNRLAVLGKNALLEKNVLEIKKYLCMPKPEIFNSEVTAGQSNLQNEHINQLLQSMPDVAEFGTENWVDLYNIRYRTANSSYPSQTRLDNITPNIMPFIQPNILNAVLNLPPVFRSRELINRKMLKNFPSLKHFPLARYNTIIPFQYNKFSCLIWGKIMRNVLKEKSDNNRRFLEINKDYLLSRFSDSNFRNSDYYNKKLIKDTVTGYYNGQNNNSNFILWWMTFDQWHQLLK